MGIQGGEEIILKVQKMIHSVSHPSQNDSWLAQGAAVTIYPMALCPIFMSHFSSLKRAPQLWVGPFLALTPTATPIHPLPHPMQRAPLCQAWFLRRGQRRCKKDNNNNKTVKTDSLGFIKKGRLLETTSKPSYLEVFLSPGHWSKVLKNLASKSVS